MLNKFFKPLLYTLMLITNLILNSCNDETTSPDFLNKIDGAKPVIPGIVLTNYDGYEMGYWRNPYVQPSISYKPFLNDTIVGPNSLGIQIPFPNPSFDRFSIYFRLPVATNVTLWAEKGRLPEESDSKPELVGGGKFVTRNSNEKIVLFEENLMLPGNYAYYWNALSTGLSAGFYRIYLKADGHLLYTDLLFAKDISDLPYGIREKFERN